MNLRNIAQIKKSRHATLEGSKLNQSKEKQASGKKSRQVSISNEPRKSELRNSSSKKAHIKSPYEEAAPKRDLKPRRRSRQNSRDPNEEPETVSQLIARKNLVKSESYTDLNDSQERVTIMVPDSDEDEKRERKVRLPALCEIPEAKESMIMTENREMRRSYEKSTGRNYYREGSKDDHKPTALKTLK